MAIRATYNNGAVIVNNAVIKLDRIWGSKKEQWNAWVHVLHNDTDAVPAEVFSISAPYVEGENPYVALYAEVAKLNFLSDIVHDVQPKILIPVVKTVEKDTLVEQLDKAVENKKTDDKLAKKPRKK